MNREPVAIELPGLLLVAFKAGGVEAVTKLSKAFGGRKMHIPGKLAPNHPLVLAAGLNVAEAIVAEYGVSHVQFPRAQSFIRRVMAHALAASMTANELVDALGVSNRYARKLRKAAKSSSLRVVGAPGAAPIGADARQLDLFARAHPGGHRSAR